MPRVVLFGHAAYEAADGFVIVPPDTSITFYAPLGALLDQEVSFALANQEDVTPEDLDTIVAAGYFLNHDLVLPKLIDKKELGVWPKTFRAGEQIPNYYLNPAELPVLAPPISKKPSEVIRVPETTQLEELLKKLQGHDLHWAACSFAKNPNAETHGYGYAVKLSPISKMKPLYSKPIASEEEKRAARAMKFGIPPEVIAAGSARSRADSPSFFRSRSGLSYNSPSYQRPHPYAHPIPRRARSGPSS